MRVMQGLESCGKLNMHNFYLLPNIEIYKVPNFENFDEKPKFYNTPV